MIVLWAVEFKKPGLLALFYLCCVVVETWLLYFNMLIWISVNLIASPMECCGEVISGDTSAPVNNLRQTVKHTQNLLGKGRKRRVTDRHLDWWAPLPLGMIKMINFEGFFVMVIWKDFVKVKQSDLADCIRAKQPTWVRASLQWF